MQGIQEKWNVVDVNEQKKKQKRSYQIYAQLCH